jgi:selenium-binding protein 1
MASWKPDPTFYPSARMAMQAPAEQLGYMAILHAEGTKPDSLGVVDLDPRSSTYGKLVHRVAMPNAGDELHHFGWNACSSALCP